MFGSQIIKQYEKAMDNDTNAFVCVLFNLYFKNTKFTNYHPFLYKKTSKKPFTQVTIRVKDKSWGQQVIDIVSWLNTNCTSAWEMTDFINQWEDDETIIHLMFKNTEDAVASQLALG